MVNWTFRRTSKTFFDFHKIFFGLFSLRYYEYGRKYKVLWVIINTKIKCIDCLYNIAVVVLYICSITLLTHDDKQQLLLYFETSYLFLYFTTFVVECVVLSNHQYLTSYDYFVLLLNCIIVIKVQFL